MLYKFYGKHTDSESLDLMKHIVEQHMLMSSDPTTFNDPFEFLVQLDFTADEATIRERYFIDNPRDKDDDYSAWRSGAFTELYVWNATQTIRKAYLQNFGVICFSRGLENYLLWSHYANNHQGFCLAFDDSIVNGVDDVVGAGDINYLADAPIASYYADSKSDILYRLFASKLECWEYEEEYRLILNKQGLVKFRPDCLRQVILGCRASHGLRKYARQQIGNTNVEFLQMSASLSSYKLICRPIDPSTWGMTSAF